MIIAIIIWILAMFRPNLLFSLSLWYEWYPLIPEDTKISVTHTHVHIHIYTHVCTHIYIQSYIFQSFLVPTDYTYICRFAWEHHMEQLLGDVKKKWPGLCFYSCMARDLSLEKMVRIRVYLGMKIRKVERIFLFPTQML